MKTLYIEDYPTRYYAFKNPGKWVEHLRPQDRGGFECAVYCEDSKNNIKPYIYAEIVSYQGIKFLTKGQGYTNDITQFQTGISELFDTYAEAKTFLLKWIKQARLLVRGRAIKKQRVVIEHVGPYKHVTNVSGFIGKEKINHKLERGTWSEDIRVLESKIQSILNRQK